MSLVVRRIQEEESEAYCQIRAESYRRLDSERAVQMRHLSDDHVASDLSKGTAGQSAPRRA